MTRTIAIANEKGGVAKTTTALSLGGALALKGKQTALIDMDAQANLTLSLNVQLGAGNHSISDILFRNVHIDHGLVHTQVDNLYLIPADMELSLAERQLPDLRTYPQTLKRILPRLEDMDYVIIDCPPAVGAVTLMSLIAADLLLIPTVSDYFSVFALKKVLGILKTVNTYREVPLKYRVLITQLDMRLGSQKRILKELRNRLGSNLAKTIIPIDSKIRECPPGRPTGNAL